jgi:hypothetical protein
MTTHAPSDSSSGQRMLEGERISPRETRRGEAEAVRRRWGWRACDRCGDIVMLGEAMLHLRFGEGTEEVCLGCAGAPNDSSGGPSAPGSA